MKITEANGNSKPLLLKNADSAISIFPNPTKGSFSLSLHTVPKTARLLDIQGRTLRVIQIDEFHSFVDISDMNEGVYLVQVVFENGTSVFERIVKY